MKKKPPRKAKKKARAKPKAVIVGSPAPPHYVKRTLASGQVVWLNPRPSRGPPAVEAARASDGSLVITDEIEEQIHVRYMTGHSHEDIAKYLGLSRMDYLTIIGSLPGFEEWTGQARVHGKMRAMELLYRKVTRIPKDKNGNDDISQLNEDALFKWLMMFGDVKRPEIELLKESRPDIMDVTPAEQEKGIAATFEILREAGFFERADEIREQEERQKKLLESKDSH